MNGGAQVAQIHEDVWNTKSWCKSGTSDYMVIIKRVSNTLCGGHISPILVESKNE